VAAEDRVKVMVVDDHPVWRDGVRADLEGSGRVEVVAEATDGGDAIKRAREAMPEGVLMDLNLPTVPGVEGDPAHRRGVPHVKVLVLSASAEEADVLEAVKVGPAAIC
jgi:DNA-binding NarL/FixJ family response regulator